ncbi:unnamed protein product [Closterium sp. Yama58-4]|nr:unnamed protein product [Closterium sp. Yama58-4]
MNKYAMFAPGTDRTISKEEWRRQQATLIKAIDPEFSGSLVCPVTVRNWRKLEASAATSTADNGAADLSDFNGMAAAADPSAAAAALGNSLPRTEKPATSPNAEGASAGYYAPSAASSTPTSSVSTFTDSSASGASSVSLSPSPPPPGALNVLPSPSAATAPAATPAAAPAAAPAAPGSTNTSAASSPANSGKLPRVRMSLAQQIREQQMNSGRFKPLVSGRFRDGASDSGRFPMSPLEPNSGPNSGKFSAVSPSSSQGNSGAFPSPAGHYATRSMGADGGGGASGPLAMAQPSALWRQSSDGHRMAGATMEQSRMAGATMQHGQQAPPMGFCMGAQGMGAQGMGAQGMGAQGMGAQMMGAPGATVGVVPAMSPPAMGGPSQSNNLSPRDLILLRPNKWSGANVADAPLLPTFGSCALSDTASQCSSQDSFSSTPQLSRPVPSFASHPPNTGSWDGSNAEEDNEEKELDFSSVRSVCLNFEEVLETSETKEFNRVRIETIDIVPLISGMKSPFMAAAAANLPEHVLYALTFSGSDDIYLPGDESVLKLFPSRFQARKLE